MTFIVKICNIACVSVYKRDVGQKEEIVRREEEIQKWLDAKELAPEHKEVLRAGAEVMLDEFFAQNLEFGTGGMRGVIGPGTNRINEITIARVTKGYGEYLLSQKQKDKLKVVIGYDNRLYSEEFAEEVGKVLSGMGIEALIFKQLTPTPIVSYAIQKLKADGGIMITASHNPPEYNGYKIYDEQGCQILSDVTAKIVRKIDDITDIFTIARSVTNITWMDETIEDAYIEDVRTCFVSEEQPRKLRFGFSPQHGTAARIMQKMVQQLSSAEGYFVEEQMEHDPYFSQTLSANPEDEVAFASLIKLGKQHNLDALLTTDPDADRLGVAYLGTTGIYTLLTGNQLGALLIDYLLTKKKMTETSYVVKTIVTSELGVEIARKAGLKTVDVLTGFKYIGDVIEQKGKDSFFFGYEESYGYLAEPLALDKDGIQIAVLTIEMMNEYKNKNITIAEKLEELYQTFGYYKERLFSKTFKGNGGQEKIATLYEKSKEFQSTELEAIEDFEESIKIDYNTGEQTIMKFPKADVRKFYLTEGRWFCIRPSGTEPKIKIYFGGCAESEAMVDAQLDALENEVLSMLGI